MCEAACGTSDACAGFVRVDAGLPRSGGPHATDIGVGACFFHSNVDQINQAESSGFSCHTRQANAPALPGLPLPHPPPHPLASPPPPPPPSPPPSPDPAPPPPSPPPPPPPPEPPIPALVVDDCTHTTSTTEATACRNRQCRQALNITLDTCDGPPGMQGARDAWYTDPISCNRCRNTIAAFRSTHGVCIGGHIYVDQQRHLLSDVLIALEDDLNTACTAPPPNLHPPPSPRATPTRSPPPAAIPSPFPPPPTTTPVAAPPGDTPVREEPASLSLTQASTGNNSTDSPLPLAIWTDTEITLTLHLSDYVTQQARLIRLALPMPWDPAPPPPSPPMTRCDTIADCAPDHWCRASHDPARHFAPYRYAGQPCGGVQRTAPVLSCTRPGRKHAACLPSRAWITRMVGR